MRGVDVAVEQRCFVQGFIRDWRRVRKVCCCSRTACCCDGWAAARERDAGVELQCRCCEQRGRREQRAVVGVYVCYCCGLELRERGLQRVKRRGARGPRGGVLHRHDGRHGVRGVEVKVEQRG